jgi:hypothetical protein
VPPRLFLLQFNDERREADVRELSARGVTFEDYDFPTIKTIDHVAPTPGVDRSAWFKDPDGNTVALFQPE